MQRIPRIVLTGGPCAGKTTAVSYMSNWCTEHGYVPLIVPEAATSLIGGGLNPLRAEFQKSILHHVLSQEQIFNDAALALVQDGHKPVLICDRGVCDQQAYMGSHAFRDLCTANGLTHVTVRDERYDGIIFLRSAALGAEEFYGTANNKTRYESLEEARSLDARTLDAWIGTPHLFVIENIEGEQFSAKMSKTVATLARILGEPEPVETERKFLIKDFSRDLLPQHAIAIDIVQTYLVSAYKYAERVRARGEDNHWVYTHTIKEPKGPGVSIERERIVTQSEYQNLLIRRDTMRSPIHKTRFCFTYAQHYCELDVFGGRNGGLVMLEIETPENEREVSLPPYLHVDREVTEDPNYSNFSLAQVA